MGSRSVSLSSWGSAVSGLESLVNYKICDDPARPFIVLLKELSDPGRHPTSHPRRLSAARLSRSSVRGGVTWH